METRSEGKWYLVATSSSSEVKVKLNLEQRIKVMGVGDSIFEVLVPDKEEEVETPAGKKKLVKAMIYPGYCMVRMDLDDSTWGIVRNTPGVTGFVGQGKHPVPLTDKEFEKIQNQMGVGSVAPVTYAMFKVGQSVRIVDGPFSDFIGDIEEVNMTKKKLRVKVHIFGRETPVELGFSEVEDV